MAWMKTQYQIVEIIGNEKIRGVAFDDENDAKDYVNYLYENYGGDIHYETIYTMAR